MKKNELMNGDIVVLSSGSVAVVIGEGEDAYLLYQYGGFEFLDEYYDDNLYNEIDDDKIMQVFRSNGGFGFEGVDQEVPVWERDETWACPSEQEREEQHRIAVELHEAEFKATMERLAEERNDRISVIAQYFYGNRTGTEVRRDWIDHFLRGHISRELFGPKDVEDVNRKMVRVPNAEHIVIVYDQTQEDRYVNEDFPRIYAQDGAEYLERWGEELKMRVSCEIPEISFKIHTRCFACRIDENGDFQSLEDSDDEMIMKYFPVK